MHCARSGLHFLPSNPTFFHCTYSKTLSHFSSWSLTGLSFCLLTKGFRIHPWTQCVSPAPSVLIPQLLARKQAKKTRQCLLPRPEVAGSLGSNTAVAPIKTQHKLRTSFQAADQVWHFSTPTFVPSQDCKQKNHFLPSHHVSRDPSSVFLTLVSHHKPPCQPSTRRHGGKKQFEFYQRGHAC